MTTYLTVALLVLSSLISYAQAPPQQPSFGPGSNDYNHASYDSTLHGNDIHDMYWLFQPASPTPTDSAAVVFLWHGTTPVVMTDSMDVVSMHIGLIRHLARKGYTVVYPMYQYGPNQITGGQTAQRDTCAEIIKKALIELESGPHVRPKRDAQGNLLLGTCGHSRGGNLSTSLSSHYWELGIPPFQAVCANVGFDANATLDSLPPTTKWLSIIADNDYNLPNLVTEDTLIDRYCKISSIPDGNKHLLRINSDSTGGSPITADHHYYEAEIGVAGSINVLDYYGAWKLTEALMDCAFFNTNCEYCLSNPDSITYMGQWGNGNPFAAISILDDTCAMILSSAELEKGGVTVYPNPAQNEVTFDFGEVKEATISIFDLNGRLVYNQTVNGRFQSVEVSNLDSGVYVYRVQDSDKHLAGKLIVN